MEGIKEHARVVLTRPLPDDDLAAGDVGTVEAADVRPVSHREITHAREWAAS